MADPIHEIDDLLREDRTFPPPPVDHFGRALYFQSDGDIDHALAQYRALFEQNHANAEVLNNLGPRIRVAISWTT